MKANEQAFWRWLEDYAEWCATSERNPWRIVHPSEPRKKASEVFGLKSFPDIWTWTKANKGRIERAVNKGAGRAGYKMLRTKINTGYMRLVKK